MDFLDALTLGVVQGITEFLPISSTGHLILAREFFGITSEHGLAIDAVLQLATALAVLIYFRRDLLEVGHALGSFFANRLHVPIKYNGIVSPITSPAVKANNRFLLALTLGTIPAVIAGLVLEDYMETIFRSADLVAWMLIVGSLLFLAAEYAATRYEAGGERREVSPMRGLVIGLFQCLALIPGMSRSGATISGGLFLGLSREEAARFGFLLSLPILLGSGLKKFFELSGEGVLSSMGASIFVSALAAFIVGLAAIHYLLKFLRNHTLLVFVVYRILLAGIVFLLL